LSIGVIILTVIADLYNTTWRGLVREFPQRNVVMLFLFHVHLYII